MTPEWPTVELNPVQRMRVLARSLDGAVLVERVIPAGTDLVWEVAQDLEATVPTIQSHVRTLRILSHDGDRLEMDVRGYLGARTRMHAVLRPGWCLMQSRFLGVGMAATAQGGGTLFARLQTLRIPAARALRPLVLSNLGKELRLLEGLVHQLGGTTS